MYPARQGNRPERIQIDLPLGMTLDHGFQPRGKIWVYKGGKAPKRRFEPGQYIEFEGQQYEIKYCYRLVDNPHEWIWMLEERSGLRELDPDDEIGQMVRDLGCGQHTPRISYHLFRDFSDAFQFFSDIPRNGDGRAVTNRDMIAKAKLISSGEIIDP